MSGRVEAGQQRLAPWLYRRAPRLWYALRPVEWMLHLATAPFRATPDLLIIGAPRCGTTSLFWALATHPGLAVPWEKEVHFFDDRYRRGSLWYRAHFALRATVRRRSQQVFEATPSYLNHPDVPARVHQLCPDARLLVLLRNPGERAYSEWALHRSLGWEKEQFTSAAASSLRQPPPMPGEARPDECGYLRNSRYTEDLDRWIALYRSDQLLVVTFEDLTSKPTDILHRILRFAGLDEDVPLTFPSMNARSRIPLDTSLRAQLDAYFMPSMVDLQRRYNIEFS